MSFAALSQELSDVLGPDGTLAQGFDRFHFRPQQLEMAEAVGRILEEGGTLLSEAGTGTGKTFAYLAPALSSGRKVIVSTGTKNLQDQLYLRDLPKIRDALGIPAKTALLKGRSNYLCLYRLDRAAGDPRASTPASVSLLTAIRGWARKTRRGDIAELAEVPEDSFVWPLVTSTTDNCLGADCPDFDGCFLVEARRRAQESDLVVVNHHLLCADFALKDEGFGELLPAADAFIVDEAHQLPEVANQFFGASISARQLHELVRDAETDYQAEAGDMPALTEATSALDKGARDFRLLLGLQERRGDWNELVRLDEQGFALKNLRKLLDDCEAVLEALAERGSGLQACHGRCQALGALMDKVVSDEDPVPSVRWFETTRLGFRLTRTPLDIAEPFRNQMNRHATSWIFTSATLAVGESFEHFERQIGAEDAVTARWESPFDYATQALWYVPKGMPDPRDPGYTAEVIRRVEDVLTASQGRAFLLFTSHRALQEAAGLLAAICPFPLLVQGTAPRNELLERFRSEGNAVLLGTGSFWEGVDVPGDALSCVVIDKLPFAPPGDPVMQARLDAIRKGGGNPFMEYQVPQAVIALKQGAGRLIRDRGDKGLLMTCDPRMLSKSYGRVFLNAMPSFGRTREASHVVEFFERMES